MINRNNNDKEASKIVKRIFETFVEKQNATLIANELNALWLKTTAGYPWDIDAIRRLLTNEKYIGKYRYKEFFIKNEIPSIIDNETFFLVKEILKPLLSDNFIETIVDETLKEFNGNYKS